MTISVRPVASTDREAWQELFWAYLDFYEAEPNAHSTDLVWSRLNADKPEIHGLVAELDGRIVGITHFHFQMSTWSDTRLCYLEDLYVDNQVRGRGVASTLIQAVKAAAIEQGSTELFWITKSDNETARRIYDKVASLTDYVRYEIPLER